jgi:protein gp37
MSQSTPIQWCDDSVNPVMGCSAPCELRPTPRQAREVVYEFFRNEFPQASAMQALLEEHMEDHNATEIYQLRGEFVTAVLTALNEPPAKAKKIGAGLKAKLDSIYICYAHQQHLMRGSDITNPDKRANSGYAPQFEQVTKFPIRTADAARWPDLFGTIRSEKPWLNYLPRVIFVSDMADALSVEIDFDNLRREIIDVAASDYGSRHLWLWLTKMPNRMADFGRWLLAQAIPWPDNVVAMTSVTSKKTVCRAEQLKAVPARFKGLSVEPLWGEVTVPLDGIDWCIGGGQSGEVARLFDLAWAEFSQAQCKQSGTAFFIKQLGAQPMWHGKPLELKDEHGGEWDEWPAPLRIREMPAGFRSLRIEQLNVSQPHAGSANVENASQPTGAPHRGSSRPYVASQKQSAMRSRAGSKTSGSGRCSEGPWRRATEGGRLTEPPSRKPRRVQLKRTKGWRMPPNTVKVDRTSRWGNPFEIGKTSPGEGKLGSCTPKELLGVPVRDRAHAVQLFREWIHSPSEVAETWRTAAHTLCGKNLACWCSLDGPCHAEILLRLVNG